jgi:Tfp pilus assembly protein PilF
MSKTYPLALARLVACLFIFGAVTSLTLDAVAHTKDTSKNITGVAGDARDEVSSQKYNNQGSFLYARGDKVGALKKFGEAIQSDPQNATAYSSRGRCRMDMGDKEGALADYNRALELEPRNTWASYHRGLLKLDRGDAAGARHDWEETLRIDPANTSARLHLNSLIQQSKKVSN